MTIVITPTARDWYGVRPLTSQDRISFLGAGGGRPVKSAHDHACAALSAQTDITGCARRRIKKVGWFSRGRASSLAPTALHLSPRPGTHLLQQAYSASHPPFKPYR